MPLAPLKNAPESMETRKKLDRLREIVRELSVIEGEITLSSGETSQFYFDMRRTACDPEGSNLIADLILDSLAEDDVDFIGGLEVGAVPIVACVSQKSFQIGHPTPAFYVRKKPKKHGRKKLIEGHIEKGARVVIVDDVTTSGGSVMRAVEAAREFGCTVVKVITVVDRLEGAAERFAAEGCPFVALLTADDFDLSP